MRRPMFIARQSAHPRGPNGRFVLGFRRAEDAAVVSSFPGEVHRFHPVRQIRVLLEQSGCSEVAIEIANADSKPIAYAVAHRRA